MEKFLGKWEVVPSLTENFDAFCDKMDVPADTRDEYKNMITIVTIRKEGDTIVSVLEVKGQPGKQELIYQLGVPFEYTDIDGSKMISCSNLEGDKCVEKHKSEKDGVTREWDEERYLEGDMMVVVTSRDGVSMTAKFKKIQDGQN